MSDVKKWNLPRGTTISESPDGEFVLASDYAALEAKCASLKNSLFAITTRHFAESWKKRTSDAELEQYLSAGIAQLEAERDTLRQQLAERDAQIERLQMQLAACGVVALANTPESAGEARRMHPDYMSASCSDVADAVDREIALRQQRDKLSRVLESVEREHDLIRRMKHCELHRGRGSFGIAVMSDTHAIEWQHLDKELQQLIDARRTALAEVKS